MAFSHAVLPLRQLYLAFAALLLIGNSIAQKNDNTHIQGNFTSLGDALWQLTDLHPIPTSALFRRPTLGGQNFTHCCLLAMNQTLEIINGTLVEKAPFFLNSSIDELLAASAANQFPCTAAYNGNSNGAPQVIVPASWLEDSCPGWQLSDSKKESQWISPFVGFLLPAVVFCLTVPRRRKLAVWKNLFVPDLSQAISWLLAPLAMVFAGLCVVCDTVIWLSICFAFASPMILSGFYEAFLDNRIISFLVEKTRNRRLNLDMRARLLFVILVGNLDLDPEPEPQDSDIEIGIFRNRHNGDDDRWPDYTGSAERNPSSPWVHVENLIHPLRAYRDMAVGTPRQHPLHDDQCQIAGCMEKNCMERPIARSEFIVKEIGRTKTRLRTMIATQFSFGATVGAPVIFFIGTFLFTISSILSKLGDEDTSLALAFGIWYMIIPHISIVSGLLLAGNNPNTLEGVVALEFGDVEEAECFEKKHFGTKLFELAYQSRYKPQWLWLRGRSKRDWVARVWQNYETRPAQGRRGFIPDEDMAALRRATVLSAMSWIIVLGLTLLLVGVPFVLAFLTGFFTPQIGLSCRSLTFLVYATAQVSQISLWLWAYIEVPEPGKHFTFFRKNGWLDSHGFYTPMSTTSFRSKKTLFSFQSLWAIIWYNLATIFGLGGVITSIGGTMMQLMGVYSGPKCSINAGWWTRPHADVPVVVSFNDAIRIEFARRYWVPCAITATLFLGGVSFCGWWYQRRLRGIFRELVSDLGNPKTDPEEINAVNPGSGSRRSTRVL